MNLKKIVDKVKLNSISLRFEKEYSYDLPIGASKVGGHPDLPTDFHWYYFESKSMITDETRSRPLSFLAQINCKDVKEYDMDNRLPDCGILYFFYELESMVWGFDPKDKGCAKVFYYNGDLSGLKRTNFPNDLSPDLILPEIRLSFEAKYNAPSYEELFNDSNIRLCDKYSEFIENSEYNTDDNTTKLLGYADVIQNEMLLECELVTNGVYCGDNTGYKTPLRKELEQNRNQWKLLFQLDTVEKDDFELMFGDCGRIYCVFR